MMNADGMWMGFGGGFMWLFWILIIIAIVMLVKAGGGNQSSEHRDETPMEILKKRYARGEIDDEEFQRKKKELES